MSNIKVVDVIIRKTAEKTKFTGEGNLSVSISSPSVIEIQGSAQDVARYVRQGKDLLIYMKDGSVIRCNNYFVEDPETQNQSELVFNDRQELTHISFADAGEASGVAVTELTAQATPISSIQPFLEQESVLSDAPWGWIAGAALGGGAIGALLANGGDGETKTKVIDNTKEVESATPTFLLSDKAGDKQGVLSANEITDDINPTFSGTGQPGATIQIKDSSGSTIASTMVGTDGTWTVILPTQTDGEHTWSVVQIDGSKTTSAGSITVTVSTADAAITLATTAGDNVLNASEQSAGFTLSGASKNLAQGTELTVTLNGKTYAAEVGADGAWSVNVPAADAQALGDGTWTVNVSGKDAAGNTVSGSQTIGVDTTAPTLSVDTLAQDNIINAAEHNQPLTLTGKTNAEAGQIVTVTLNGKNYNATVGSDGTWSVTLAASDVQALNEGNHTLTVNVSD
ncbi:TPA: Ig-like domain-containing protein, partial [Enterobacter asburiae]